jgi:hypothetical protein
LAPVEPTWPALWATNCGLSLHGSRSTPSTSVIEAIWRCPFVELSAEG